MLLKIIRSITTRTKYYLVVKQKLYKYHDYQQYKETQIAGNLRKLNQVWANEKNIAYLSNYLIRHVNPIRFGICHGTRNGKEQAWFRKYLGIEVIGTEISPTAKNFPHTIEWDFHDVKPEWLNQTDFIYSNSFDHSYQPEQCLDAWMSCIRKDGVCILEWSNSQVDVDELDPFGATLAGIKKLLRKKYHLKAILKAPAKVPIAETQPVFLIVSHKAKKRPRPRALITKAHLILIEIYNRIVREGLTTAIYSLADLISYPWGGFPRHGVDEYMRFVCGSVLHGAHVLDAGAGSKPYEHLFRHTKYHSCEYKITYNKFHSDALSEHTFYCDLESIPVCNNSYDAIICNQVLEHVKRPNKVMLEFYRILKSDGKLFMTVPQCFGAHMVPYNYFHFIRSGLSFLAKDAGFRQVTTKPLGGIFWVLGTVMLKCYDTLMERIPRWLKHWLIPFHIFSKIMFLLVNIILFQLDRLDNNRTWTLNYGVTAIK